MALHVSGVQFEHREILLRDKPDAMLAASPKGTVPVLVTPDGVFDESLDVMLWALGQSDPENWLDQRDDSLSQIAQNDSHFKQALDRYKYASRHDGEPEKWRAIGSKHLVELDTILAQNGQLLGNQPRLADFALFPFVRQFANTDRTWFDAQEWPHLQRWLEEHLASPRFEAIMAKHPIWVDDS